MTLFRGTAGNVRLRMRASKPRRARGLVVVGVLAVGLTAACGEDQPTATPGTAGPERSSCDEAFLQGRADEAEGKPTFVAFRGSVQTCRTLAEWTATARALGKPLRGEEATFVSNVCADADATTRESEICREADRLFRSGG